jgi:hypothetical protein
VTLGILTFFFFIEKRDRSRITWIFSFICQNTYGTPSVQFFPQLFINLILGLFCFTRLCCLLCGGLNMNTACKNGGFIYTRGLGSQCWLGRNVSTFWRENAVKKRYWILGCWWSPTLYSFLASFAFTPSSSYFLNNFLY